MQNKEIGVLGGVIRYVHPGEIAIMTPSEHDYKNSVP
jgi:hypothetical protein